MDARRRCLVERALPNQRVMAEANIAWLTFIGASALFAVGLKLKM
jgi:hypothetical protein